MVSCESLDISLQESDHAAIENNCPQVSAPMPAGETEVGCFQTFTGLRSGYEQSFDLRNGHSDDVGKWKGALSEIFAPLVPFSLPF